MLAKLPQANGALFTLKRAPEIVDDFGSIPRTPHIPLSSIKQFGNVGSVGLSLFVAWIIMSKGGSESTGTNIIQEFDEPFQIAILQARDTTFVFFTTKDIRNLAGEIG